MSDTPKYTTFELTGEALHRAEVRSREMHERLMQERAEARVREQKRREEAERRERERILHNYTMSVQDDFHALVAEAKHYQSADVAKALRAAEHHSYQPRTHQNLKKWRAVCDQLREACDQGRSAHLKQQAAERSHEKTHSRPNLPAPLLITELRERLNAVSESMDVLGAGLDLPWSALDQARQSLALTEQRIKSLQQSDSQRRSTVKPGVFEDLEACVAQAEETTDALQVDWAQEAIRQATHIETKATITRMFQQMGMEEIEPDSFRFAGGGRAVCMKIDSHAPDGSVSMQMTMPGLEGNKPACAKMVQEISSAGAGMGLDMNVDGYSTTEIAVNTSDAATRNRKDHKTTTTKYREMKH